MDAVSRSRRLYKRSEGKDPFLRTGFRVGTAAARERLNQIAIDVLDGMDALERLGLDRAAEQSTQLDPKRAVGHVFGVLAASALRRQDLFPAERRRSRWNFVFDLGYGFGVGRSNRGTPANKLALTGLGLYLGYWHWREYVEEQTRAPSDPAVNRGLGAMIWMGSGMDPMTSASIAHSFSAERQPDIWKGIGFAMSFLGDGGEIRFGAAGAMLEAAGPAAEFLVQGIAFGAFQRERLQSIDKQVEQLCREVTCESASALVKASLDRFSDWE